MITLNATGTHYHAQVEDDDTAQLRRILAEHLPKVMERFAQKNRQYGENVFPLGAAGQFPEIDRKVRLLKSMIWDKRDPASLIDSPDETIDDLIGHLLMLKDCLASIRLGPGHVSRIDTPPATPVVSEPDELGVLRYPAGFRGRHTYLVAEEVAGRLIFAAHGHTLQIAVGKYQRCPWKLGDERGGDVQCVGIYGHEDHRDEADQLSEQWHINNQLEAWPV